MHTPPAPCSAYLRPATYDELTTLLHKVHPALDAPATVVMQLRVAALMALRAQAKALSNSDMDVVCEYINLQLDSLLVHGDFTTSAVGFALIHSGTLDTRAERLLYDVMSCIMRGSEQVAFETLAYAKHVLLVLPYTTLLGVASKTNQPSDLDMQAMQATIIRYVNEAEDFLIDAP